MIRVPKSHLIPAIGRIERVVRLNRERHHDARNKRRKPYEKNRPTRIGSPTNSPRSTQCDDLVKERGVHPVQAKSNRTRRKSSEAKED